MHRRTCCALSATVAVLACCLGCAPAERGGVQAESRPAYVRGAGRLSDDWSSEGRLSAEKHAHSDLVAMWQAILWADGYLLRSQIDCRFGAGTDGATRTWQNNHGLVPDGIVGTKTFGLAGQRLTRRDGLVVYRGEERALPLRRGRDGRYYAQDAGTYKPLRADGATLRVCD